MISQETENVTNVDEVILAFKALTTGGDKTYIAENELYAVSLKEQWKFVLIVVVIGSAVILHQDFPFESVSDRCLICFTLSFSQNLTKEQADYCVRKMVPYVDPKTGERVPGTLDYSKFVHELFVN